MRAVPCLTRHNIRAEARLSIDIDGATGEARLCIGFYYGPQEEFPFASARFDAAGVAQLLAIAGVLGEGLGVAAESIDSAVLDARSVTRSPARPGPE
jgi:hypothetical protein